MAVIRQRDTGIVLEVNNGTRLNTLGNELNTGMPCKQMSCGSCIFRVMHGKENLNGISPREQRVLENKGAPDNARLMCATTIQSGEVVIEQHPRMNDPFKDLKCPRPEKGAYSEGLT